MKLYRLILEFLTTLFNHREIIKNLRESILELDGYTVEEIYAKSIEGEEKGSEYHINFKSKYFQVFSFGLWKMFKESPGVKNYLSVDFSGPDGLAYSFIIQKKVGKTPSDLYYEQLSINEKLRAELEVVKG